MREFATPATVDIPMTGNLTDDVVTNGLEAPDAVVFRRRVDARWEDVTAATFLAEVAAVAKGLIASGIAAGDRVALISRTRYEWTLVDYAIWFAGRGDRADLRDVLGRAGPLDPPGLRCHRGGRRGARPHGPDRRRSAATSPT